MCFLFERRDRSVRKGLRDYKGKWTFLEQLKKATEIVIVEPNDDSTRREKGEKATNGVGARQVVLSA
jgi:bifunctional ADP-heptose synthase (sugar kinase/adenylyltransferase)